MRFPGADAVDLDQVNAGVRGPDRFDERGTLVCGVSGFGFGGTNAHVVLSSYEPPKNGRTAEPGIVQRGQSAAEERPIPKVAFLFPGQGCHYPEMGKRLFAEDAVFADAVLQCEAAMAEQGLLDGLSLSRDILWPQTSRDPPLLEDGRYTQPASK